MGHIEIINWDEEGQIAWEVKHAEDVFKEGELILGSTCGLSMETISDRLCALYPRWEGKWFRRFYPTLASTVDTLSPPPPLNRGNEQTL